LLEGLEVSEVMLSEAINETISFRLDSEFFKKEYLFNNLHKNFKVEKLQNITSKIDVGFVGTMVKYYTDKGIPLLQTKNINEFFVKDDETIQITNDFHLQLKKSQINYEDILIARSGSFGKASIYLKSEVINSSDIIIIKANQLNINPYYLIAFLNSRFGVSQMLRFASGGLQGHVNLTILEELQVPILSVNFQQQIEGTVKLAYSKREQSQTLYRQAEELLLETIGLKDFTPSREKVNIKTFKESFLGTGRLDAEYYQPKYEEMIKHIETFETERLINIVSIKKSIEPGSDAYETEGIPFIRVSNLSKFGLTDTDIYLDKAKFGNLGLQPKKDTILLSKDGSVGIAYKIEQDLELITSGALLHLTVKNKDFLPDYVTLVLNSEVVKMQAERDAGGSIIQHWKPSEIEQVIIPKVPMSIQQQISALIQESFALRKESERLLVEAKEMVEREIEKGGK